MALPLRAVESCTLEPFPLCRGCRRRPRSNTLSPGRAPGSRVPSPEDTTFLLRGLGVHPRPAQVTLASRLLPRTRVSGGPGRAPVPGLIPQQQAARPRAHGLPVSTWPRPEPSARPSRQSSAVCLVGPVLPPSVAEMGRLCVEWSMEPPQNPRGGREGGVRPADACLPPAAGWTPAS